MKLDVALLPNDAKGINLCETVCIVLDIFRATTSITTAMANGCRAIIPVLSVEDARLAAEKVENALFAGERQSIRIDGFDFGNSPFEFSQEKVKDKTIIMTTTNGTVAIHATSTAHRTLIGSFLNARAVCKQAKQYGKDVLIVCAGTDGFFSLEDALCAGFMVQLLQSEGDMLTDAAYGASLMYTNAQGNLVETAAKSRNGKRLCDLNRMDDIENCFRVDALQVVPQYVEGKICR